MKMAESAAERDNPGVIMLPPLILLIAIAVAVALELLVPLAFLPAPGLASWLSWLGAVVFVTGLWISISGNREFVRSGTNVNPYQPALKLVTSGPYRFTRNPMYLGMIVAFAGIVLTFALELGILVWVLFALTLHYGVVMREERYLTRKFGAPYEDFLKRTRRWV
jgi:protein-S-isoprenylcysteine O-methyltransferase Ste14